jgi:hypothetical protein
VKQNFTAETGKIIFKPFVRENLAVAREDFVAQLAGVCKKQTVLLRSMALSTET